jgi:hypothetical protein
MDRYLTQRNCGSSSPLSWAQRRRYSRRENPTEVTTPVGIFPPFRRHGRDPRVIPVLLARLDEEERRATEHGRYSPSYETVARYLVRLGQPIGRAAVRRYMRATRARGA